MRYVKTLQTKEGAFNAHPSIFHYIISIHEYIIIIELNQFQCQPRDIPDRFVRQVVHLEDLLVLVGHAVGHDHDGLVAVGALVVVGPAE